ncbi:MAG: glycosyltransferase 87 family protein [Thermodesulfobacteriota bacterium]|nr:glycosyltransferase 87 family protein [Thermodesulfobacteriota bacterium]
MHNDPLTPWPLKRSAALFAVCLVLFIAMAYGGIRTPDGEIVFRVGESLARQGSFAIDAPLATWEPFAVLKGKDNRLYGVFAPTQSILLAPLIKAGLAANRSHWYKSAPFPIPVSFCVGARSLKQYVFGMPPDHPEQHALRFIASFFTPMAAGLMIVLFFLIVRQTALSSAAGFLTALVLALATPVWHYAGTMFKEPLTMVFVLWAFFCLVKNDPVLTLTRPALRRVFSAGLLSGLALTTHLTAALFAPFWGLYALFPYLRADAPKRNAGPVNAALAFAAGFLIPAVLFGFYNYHRFGSVLTTGRASQDIAYGTFAMPWEGLAGLLASPGKGIIFFCPVIIAGILLWPYLHRKHRHLSILLIAMMLFRLVFIACRSDWHGGFCLGPRQLLPVVPFLLIPIGLHFAEKGRRILDRPWQRLTATGLFFLAACQQLYFCLGEPISFYYILKAQYLVQGIHIIASNAVYFRWQTSPLLHLLDARRGPFLLQSVPLTNLQLFGLLAVILLGLTTAVSFCLSKAGRP